MGDLGSRLGCEDGVAGVHDDAVAVLVDLHPDLVVLGDLLELGPAVVHQHVEVTSVDAVRQNRRVEGDDEGIIGEHGCCIPHLVGVDLAGVQDHRRCALQQEDLDVHGAQPTVDVVRHLGLVEQVSVAQNDELQFLLHPYYLGLEDGTDRVGRVHSDYGVLPDE